MSEELKAFLASLDEAAQAQGLSEYEDGIRDVLIAIADGGVALEEFISDIEEEL